MQRHQLTCECFKGREGPLYPVPQWALTPANKAWEQAGGRPLHLQLGVRSQSSVLVDEDKAVSSMLPAVAALSVGLLGNIFPCGLGQTCLFLFEVPQLGV